MSVTNISDHKSAASWNVTSSCLFWSLPYHIVNCAWVLCHFKQEMFLVEALSSLAYTIGTTSKHQKATWPELYRMLIVFLHIVVWHMSVHSLARGYMLDHAMLSKTAQKRIYTESCEKFYVVNDRTHNKGSMHVYWRSNPTCMKECFKRKPIIIAKISLIKWAVNEYHWPTRASSCCRRQNTSIIMTEKYKLTFKTIGGWQTFFFFFKFFFIVYKHDFFISKTGFLVLSQTDI